MTRIKETRFIITFSGALLMAGGVLTFLVNLIFLPLLDSLNETTNKVTSSLYLWRQSLSLLVAVLLLVSVLGLFLYLFKLKSSRLILVSIIGLLIWSSLLIAQEWNQIFFVRSLTMASPEAMDHLESENGMGLFDLSAIFIFAVFVLSWIFFSLILLKQKIVDRRIPILIIVGFFASPMLSAILPVSLAGIIGNAVLGFGWFLLGRTLYLSK